MRYLKNNQGVTLVEILVTLVIGTMIVGLTFLVPQLFQQQNNYNHSFNTAKNQVLLVTNAILERVEKARLVDIKGTETITLEVIDTGTEEKFLFKPLAEKDYLYEVQYQVTDPISKDITTNDLGTVGFYNNEFSGGNTFFILTLWAPYTQSNGVEEKFVVTQGFHTSVINE